MSRVTNMRRFSLFRFFALFLLGGIYLVTLQACSYSAEPASVASPPVKQINSTEITVTNVPNTRVISRNSDGLFYVKGSIDGVPVRFAVDTGASVVVLNSEDAERVGLNMHRQSHNRIRTASGYSAMMWRRADNLMIEGRTVGSLDLAVMEQGPDVSLLGLNALSRLASVTIKEDQLIIRY